MEYTVGIPTYHRPDRLSAVLASILEQMNRPHETIVVDDSADDRTERVVRERTPAFEAAGVTLRYRHRTDERSMPGARNEILRMATGDVICFLDDDVVCEQMWLEALHRTYREHPDAVAVGGPAIVVDGDREPVYDTVRADRNMNMINGYGETEEIADRWIPASAVRTDTLSGANMSFKTGVLTDLGGFDPGYGGSAHWEETDVFAKLLDHDSRVVYHPEALVYHYKTAEGGSRETASERRRAYWFARNHVRFKWRNFRSTFFLGLVRLLVYTEHAPAPVWKHLGTMVIEGDSSQLWFLKGYLDGVYYETDLL